MAAPRKSSADLAGAIARLEAGDWQAAHQIVQNDESALAAWLHGIVHTLEGDLDNARYWYRRVKRAFPGPEAVERELAEARRALGGPAGAPQEKA
jgi:hypothetical protein